MSEPQEQGERVGLSCGHRWSGSPYSCCPQCGDMAAEQSIDPPVAGEAPERVWIGSVHGSFQGVTRYTRIHEHKHFDNDIEYIRADLTRTPPASAMAAVDANIQRFLERFIVKVEPFYERKHGKLPPQESSLWELLAFVKNALEATTPAAPPVAETCVWTPEPNTVTASGAPWFGTACGRETDGFDGSYCTYCGKMIDVRDKGPQVERGE